VAVVKEVQKKLTMKRKDFHGAGGTKGLGTDRFLGGGGGFIAVFLPRASHFSRGIGSDVFIFLFVCVCNAPPGSSRIFGA
jgi:hypothetical protein